MRILLSMCMLLLTFVLGCGARSVRLPVDDGDGLHPDSETERDGAPEVGEDAGIFADGGNLVDAGEELDVCEGVLALDDSCRNDRDCMLVQHQSDRCGSVLYLGIPASVSSDFEAAEAECRASYPPCECEPTYGVEEEGAEYRVGPDDETVTTRCDDGACISLQP